MWVAADRGARMAREMGHDDFADRWQAKADEFQAEICEKGCRDGVFRQHYDTDALDASLLLMPLYRFLPGDDPRIVATVRRSPRTSPRTGWSSATRSTRPTTASPARRAPS